MKTKTEIFLFSMFAIGGVVTMIGAIFMLINEMSFKERAVEVTGKIVDIQMYYESVNGERERRYDVYVDYTYNGIEYKNVPLGEYSATMSIGKNITLLCDPDNPGDIRTDIGIVLFPMILFFMGGIFSLVGIFPLVSGVKNNARQKRLLTDGRVLQAVVENVSLNTGYRVNGRSPYIIYCTYTDEYNGTVYRFKSDNLWNNPEILFPMGSTINVYVDKNDFSNYYVDAEHSISTNKRVVDFT